MSLDKAIQASARDIADAISNGQSPRRRANLCNYLEAAIWAAAVSAEELPGNAWIDPKAMDSWLRTAADSAAEKVDLPDNLTDEQFRKICERIGLSMESIGKILSNRYKLEPELKSDIDSIIGSSAVPALPLSEPAPPESPIKKEFPPISPLPMPSKPSVPEKSKEKAVPEKLLSENVSDISSASVPPKRDVKVKRDNVVSPDSIDNEFDGDITKNINLPGAPKP